MKTCEYYSTNKNAAELLRYTFKAILCGCGVFIFFFSLLLLFIYLLNLIFNIMRVRATIYYREHKDNGTLIFEDMPELALRFLLSISLLFNPFCTYEKCLYAHVWTAWRRMCIRICTCARTCYMCGFERERGREKYKTCVCSTVF